MNTAEVSRSQALAHIDDGAQLWNEWRSRDGILTLDLRDANLRGHDLSTYNFQQADLRGANLREAFLRNSDLTRSLLSGADLSGAALEAATLIDADARGAYLLYASAAGSNMSRANLNGANLTGADLQRANLKSTILLETILADCNLSDVEHLESCDQPGPSVVDHRTYVRSGGLPLSFMRACGLPDSVIEGYAASLTLRPSCFLSYSAHDERFAKKLYASLQESGVRCWFASEDLDIGAKIRPALDTEILSRDAFIVILSAHSISSPWVEKEVETAFERAYRGEFMSILPIRLDDAVLNANQPWAADLRRSRYIGDFSKWEDSSAYGNALERLLRGLRSKVAS